MSLICRWGGVSVEMGLGERIPASLWDGAAKDLFRKNLTQDELHAVLVMDQKSSEARRKKSQRCCACTSMKSGRQLWSTGLVPFAKESADHICSPKSTLTSFSFLLALIGHPRGSEKFSAIGSYFKEGNLDL